jgi:hypothetical protein
MMIIWWISIAPRMVSIVTSLPLETDAPVAKAAPTLLRILWSRNWRYAALRGAFADDGIVLRSASLAFPNAVLTTISPIKYANSRIKNVSIRHPDCEEYLSLAHK